jgi:signal transduction histidine kinase
MEEKNIEKIIETNIPLESLFNLLLNHILSSIDAKAGSLVTVNKKRRILQIRSRLGVPKKGRKGEPEYSIDGNSVASQAVKSKQPVVYNDLLSESDKNYVPSRSDNKIRSILSVPIIHEDDVIAVINADSELKDFFNEEKKNRLVDIAAEVAPIISERISFLDAIKEVSIELSKSPSEGDVDKVLQIISDVAVKSLGIDIVSLYEYDQSNDEFIIDKGGPKIGGSLNDDTYMRTKVYKQDVPYQVLQKRDGPLFFKDVAKIDFLSKEIKRKKGKDRPRFIEREKIKSMAAFLLPNRAYEDPNEEIVGVLFANYKSEHEFNVDEKDALATFADYAATAILNSRKEKQRSENAKEFEKSKKAEQLKDVLDKITSAAMGSFDQDFVLESILETTMDTLQAEACSIYIETETDSCVFECIAGAGFAESIVGKANYKIGEGLTGSIAQDGEDVLIFKMNHLEKYKSKGKWLGKYDTKQWGEKRMFKNLIAIPIRLENKIIGVIKAENKKSAENKPFTRDDLESLKIIGTVIGLTIENIRLQNKIENQLKSISARAAHRINNQLFNYASIELDIKAALNSSPVNLEGLHEAYNSIQDTTKNLKVLVDEIKEFGKPLEVNLKLSDLNAIIKKEAWLMKPKEYIIDTASLDERIPDFLLDPVHFTESIKELIRNSRKAILSSEIDRGLVEFKTELLTIEKEQYARITLEDNGPGFKEDFPIFEPYKTTYKDSTGLGLATVKEVIEKHGGTIEAKKRSEQGACFEILLPIRIRS